MREGDQRTMKSAFASRTREARKSEWELQDLKATTAKLKEQKFWTESALQPYIEEVKIWKEEAMKSKKERAEVEVDYEVSSIWMISRLDGSKMLKPSLQLQVELAATQRCLAELPRLRREIKLFQAEQRKMAHLQASLKTAQSLETSTRTRLAQVETERARFDSYTRILQKADTRLKRENFFLAKKNPEFHLKLAGFDIMKYIAMERKLEDSDLEVGYL